jgi:predicted metal-dependent phosphoesterase TrpH
MLRVEFHCHTISSKDSLTKPETLVKVCQKKGIDRVIVTDHNNIVGALAAKELDPERVIIGEEIMTTKGEILAAYVKEEILPGQSPLAVIEQLRQQGAFISVSHPFDILRNGHWEMEDLLEILPLVDAIETFNARCLQAKFNQQAQEFAQSHRLAGTVGSDAHAAFELGRATLLLPEFTDADGLRAVIRSGQPDVFLSSPWVHFTSRYAVMKKGLIKRQM